MSWVSRHNQLTRAVDHTLGGVTVTSGAVSGMGILDMPGQVLLDGMVISTDYTLTTKASDFGGLIYGAAITVNGVNYSVRETRLIGDGLMCEISLQKVAPDSAAPGQSPATFGLTDLTDVELTSPTAGEALIYNGTQWVDARDQAGAFVFTQSTPAAIWTINHNLGFIPSVELFNSGSQEIDGDVVHTSANQTVVNFTGAVAGFARLV